MRHRYRPAHGGTHRRSGHSAIGSLSRPSNKVAAAVAAVSAVVAIAVGASFAGTLSSHTSSSKTALATAATPTTATPTTVGAAPPTSPMPTASKATTRATSTATSQPTTAKTKTRTTNAASTTTARASTVTTKRARAAAPSSCSVSRLLVASCGRWFGVAPQAYSPLSTNEALAVDEGFTGSSFSLVHVYNTNGKLFPSATDIEVATRRGDDRLLYENWKPATDLTWAQVAAGGADSRIDAEAGYLNSHFDFPFLLTIWHEPENDVNAAAGSGMSVSDYSAMFHHVVTRLRADGATKFLSVMNYMGFGRWNTMLDGLWPGGDVVDWIAYDPYQYKPSGSTGHDFQALVDAPYYSAPGFYTWATTNHPGMPLMLGEWGAFFNPGDPSGQADFFRSVVSQLDRFPALKALVYFDMNTKYHATDGKGTAPDSSADSLSAWRELVRSTAFSTPSVTYVDGAIRAAR